MAKKLSGFGAAFAEARADGKKTLSTLLGAGKDSPQKLKKKK
jgi:hypothetical protein